MRKLALAVGLVALISGAAVARDGRVGLMEDCSTTAGWFEWDRNQKEVAPRTKLESRNGLLLVHLNRGLLRAAKKHAWCPEGVDRGSILRKNYGEVDLDKYHYLVVKVKEKGSGVFFGVNGYDTKCGFTTGVTAVDLKDYDDERIHGKRTVRLEMDVHDNLTTLVVDEIKLVSELTPEEKKGFIDRGLTIRHEKLKAKMFHGLDAVMARRTAKLPSLEGEEMVVFRDTATGAVTTRLTAHDRNDYFGEGGLWSGDGAAIRFNSNGRLGRGKPVLLLGEGKVVAAPSASWALWSAHDPLKLWLVSRSRNREYRASLWNRKTAKTEPVASFTVPQTGGYTEVKRITKSGKLIVGFRETPHMAVVDAKTKTAKTIELSTRLKDVSFTPDEKYLTWGNCYTYEGRWLELATGREGITSRYNVGHASGGKSGTVGSFGRHLKIFIPRDVFNTRTAGDRVTVWANWQNDVVTDYGSFTDDNEWIFTNGTSGDVAQQHTMVPSKDTGAVLRVAKYFTKFSWSSTTYSRPSPDYTKLCYNENMNGATSTEIMMAYTHRPDPPQDVKLIGRRLVWKAPRRSRETAGYNVYHTATSGRDYVRVNSEPVTATSFSVPKTSGYYAVAAVEHSGLEGLYSQETGARGGRSFYFEAERMDLTPPARRFFLGECGNFQCVRINAESPAEQARDGVISVDTSAVPRGRYSVWLRVKGRGRWAYEGRKSLVVDADRWEWIKPVSGTYGGRGSKLSFLSRDDSLMCDAVVITAERFTPDGADPRDPEGPAAVTGLKAEALGGGKVKLSWNASDAPDVQYYSVYFGGSEGFKCGNATVIRSVKKTSITDAGARAGKAYYKVVAFDSRLNAGEAATVTAEVR